MPSFRCGADQGANRVLVRARDDTIPRGWGLVGAQEAWHSQTPPALRDAPAQF